MTKTNPSLKTMLENSIVPGEWGGGIKIKVNYVLILNLNLNGNTISLPQLQVQLELGGGQLQPDHWLSDHLPKVTGLAFSPPLHC